MSLSRSSRPRGTTTAALAGLAALALAGCSAAGGGSDAPSPSSPEQFWGGFAMVRVSEVDPATSLAELTERGELIVRGAVAAVENPRREGSRVTVEVGETLAGDAPERVVVDLIGMPGEGTADAPPEEEVLWFLTPAQEGGRWNLVSQYGLIGEDGRGAPDTLLNPADPMFEWGERPASLGEVQADVEAALGD